MNHSSDPLPGDSSLRNYKLQRRILTTAQDQDWQAAQERVLLYLRALNLPPERSLELALEALRRAGREDYRITGGNPASNAMRALREIMSERELTLFDRRLGSQAVRGTFRSSEVRTMPPLNRKSMVPEEIDRRPWISFIARCFKMGERAAPRSVTTQLLYLILLLVLLIVVLLDAWG